MQDAHGASGLTEECRAGTVTLAAAGAQLLAFVTATTQELRFKMQVSCLWFCLLPQTAMVSTQAQPYFASCHAPSQVGAAPLVCCAAKDIVLLSTCAPGKDACV